MIIPPKIAVIIPVFNETSSISKVIDEIPKELNAEIIVVNNGSTDSTAEMAKMAGALVIDEPKKGYGRACLKGISYLSAKIDKPDIVVFIDGDYSDFPNEMPLLIHKIMNENNDLVIGSRVLGNKEKGAMLPQQVIGNKIATTLMSYFYQTEFTDLGPFRAIKYSSLMELGMIDQTFGWTVEMQVKAAKMKMKCAEVPVSYRKRIGISKITGTVKGTLLAGYKIISTIIKYR